MITIQLVGKHVKLNQRRARKLISLLPKKAYYHFLFEPQLIIRVHNKDRKYICEYLDKKKWKYNTYAYPFSKKVGKWGSGKGYGEDKKSMTYLYRDEFIPLMHLESRLALKSKRKQQLGIIERYYHTFLNSLGYDWETEARITNWLLAGRINTFKKYYGDGAIISLLCMIILFNCKINRFLIKGLS